MNILAIDTANELLGIAISKAGQPVIELTSNVKKDHSSRLMPAIVDAMEKAELEPNQLSKIVVSQGPGSYTGVRIGITTAKTMAWALNIPIHSISSLHALAYNGALYDGYVWPFFDARRQAVFTALYKVESGVITEVKNEQHVSMEQFLSELQKLDEKILCLSPHINVFRPMIENKLREKSVIPEQLSFHLTKPSHYIYISEFDQSVQTHLVKPNYLRMTEAEANLLKMKKVNTNNNG